MTVPNWRAHLSYMPLVLEVGREGIEPATNGLRVHCST